MATTADERSVERTRTFSWSDPSGLATVGREMAGIDLMRAMIDGRLPKPPIADLIDASLIAVGEGTATFALQPAEWMYNPIGSVHGGIAATLLDSCMGCAVHTLLPAGVGYTTTDLQVRFVRGISDTTGRVLAAGRVIHPGRRVMTVEATMTAEDGDRLLAHGTSACIVLR
ncbi:MAG TPA: PaaI family thioesterase [Solirubrobacteraceae bacterium]|jgi:uncharacterized protein (TIGR00369 family)